MFKNYFKIALNSLRKKPLYTTVSLFGISFTLMVLIFAVAVLENELGSNPPLDEPNSLLFISTFNGVGYARTTQTSYDSTFVDNQWKIDSTEVVTLNKSVHENNTNSGMSLKLFNTVIKPLSTPKYKSSYVADVPINVYRDNQKLELDAIYVDAEFWRILNFDFLEGKPFNETVVESNQRQIVIKRDAAQAYFGKRDSYLGLNFDWGNNGAFKVVGVVATSSSSNEVAKPDLYFPLFFAGDIRLDYGQGYFGSCHALLKAHHPQQLEAIVAELDKVEKSIQARDQFDAFFFHEKSLKDMYAWSFIGNQEERKGNALLTYIAFGLVFFMLIPLINLINLNTTRIIERSAEIGVRKAFGANTNHILVQFLFENLLLTLVGGVLGLVFSMGLLNLFNSYQWLENTNLSLNWGIAFIGFIIIVLFSFLSGIVPAYKISRIPIVNALKTASL